MSDDEKFDMWLREAATAYNNPGDVPRAEMWRAIREGLDQQPAKGSDGEQPIVPLPVLAPARQRAFGAFVPGRRLVVFALAAATILAVGIQVGRRWPPATGDSTLAVGAPLDSTPPADTYAAAASEHLENAEVLLASVRTASPLDSVVGDWARNLLSDTRLLLASPAASDLGRRRLLEDLELTLVQLVQLSAATTDDDRTILRRSLERGDLITRLRTAAPLMRSGT